MDGTRLLAQVIAATMFIGPVLLVILAVRRFSKKEQEG